MHTQFTPFTLLLDNLPTRVRLPLTRLWQAQPDLRVAGVGAKFNGLTALMYCLRPGLVAAQILGAKILGIIAGLGNDGGTSEAQAIRPQGNTALVQNEALATVSSMPKSVIKAGWANEVLALHNIVALINDTVQVRSLRGIRAVSPAHTAF